MGGEVGLIRGIAVKGLVGSIGIVEVQIFSDANPCLCDAGIGFEADNLQGNFEDNIIEGGAGADILDGGGVTLLGNYDTDDGKLYFDRDGSGAGARVLLATLDNIATLTLDDFVIL